MQVFGDGNKTTNYVPPTVDGSEIQKKTPGIYKNPVNNGINYLSTGAGLVINSLLVIESCLPYQEYVLIQFINSEAKKRGFSLN